MDSATNRTIGPAYYPNGNAGSMSGMFTYAVYDVENRIQSVNLWSGGIETYSYGMDNKRVWKLRADGLEEIYLYGAMGEKLGTYRVSGWAFSGGGFVLSFAQVNTNLYFAGKMIQSQGSFVSVDRLGSVRQWGGYAASKYYAYGEEYTTTQQDREKFGTYYRDGSTGLDYADQRYYASTMGRFLTPDPYRASAQGSDSGSWNRYAYVRNDPVNYSDRTGMVEDEDPYYNIFWDCWWCFFPPGGGGYFVPVLRPDPNWQTNGQVLRNVAAWGALIAAALAAEQAQQQDEPGFRYVAYLQASDDCYVKQIFKDASVVRRRRYQAIDNFGRPYGSGTLTVSEHNYVQSGSLSAFNSTWNVDTNGQFDDFLSRGSGGDTVEFQEFTASNTAGLNSFSSVPVMVRDPSLMNGPFFGVLGINLRQHTVFINSNDGKIGGQLKYCDKPDL